MVGYSHELVSFVHDDPFEEIAVHTNLTFNFCPQCRRIENVKCIFVAAVFLLPKCPLAAYPIIYGPEFINNRS